MTDHNTVAAPSDAQTLHAAIMNIPCPPHPEWNGGEQEAHRIGHRDARHAAAELASASAQAAPVGARDEDFAGLLFDFGGFLTTHKVRWKFSAYDDASPMVYAIEEFAALRGLPLEPCNVKDWRTTSTPPPQPAPAAQGLTDAQNIVAELMRAIDAYAFDYGRMQIPKLAPSRFVVERTLTAALASAAQTGGTKS